MGSEDDEDDPPAADIQAAVQGLINHELTEEAITRSSKQRSGDQPPQGADSGATPSTNGYLENEPDQQGSFSVQEDSNVQELAAFGKQGWLRYNNSSATEVTIPTTHASEPPLPKLKLRINNGPMTVEKVEPCGVNGL